MKKTINVCEAVLKLKTQITEAKEYILANPNAINILENNLDKVIYEALLINPNIFEYDYKQMELNTSIFKEELVAIALSPERICKLYNQGFTSDDL